MSPLPTWHSLTLAIIQGTWYQLEPQFLSTKETLPFTITFINLFRKYSCGYDSIRVYTINIISQKL